MEVYMNSPRATIPLILATLVFAAGVVGYFYSRPSRSELPDLSKSFGPKNPPLVQANPLVGGIVQPPTPAPKAADAQDNVTQRAAPLKALESAMAEFREESETEGSAAKLLDTYQDCIEGKDPEKYKGLQYVCLDFVKKIGEKYPALHERAQEIAKKSSSASSVSSASPPAGMVRPIPPAFMNMAKPLKLPTRKNKK